MQADALGAFTATASSLNRPRVPVTFRFESSRTGPPQIELRGSAPQSGVPPGVQTVGERTGSHDWIRLNQTACFLEGIGTK